MRTNLDRTKAASGIEEASGEAYRYTRFTTRLMLRDLRWGAMAPQPGEEFPAFDLASIDGGHVRSSDLIGREPFVIVLGSLTCPMTAGSASGMRAVFEEFGEQVRFISVYTREAHPGESIPQPDNIETKSEHAGRLATRDRYAWSVAIDDLAGTLHRRLDGKPNALFLVDREGRLAFRAIWAADHKAIRRALEAVSHGNSPSKATSSAMMGPMMRALPWIDRTVSGGGHSASRDLWRAAAPMALMAKLARLLPARHS